MLLATAFQSQSLAVGGAAQSLPFDSIIPIGHV